MKGDDEIIKALSLCAAVSKTMDVKHCADCPLFSHYKDCMPRLINGANDLVRRLTTRNERVKKENKKLKNKSEENE